MAALECANERSNSPVINNKRVYIIRLYLWLSKINSVKTILSEEKLSFIPAETRGARLYFRKFRVFNDSNRGMTLERLLLKCFFLFIILYWKHINIISYFFQLRLKYPNSQEANLCSCHHHFRKVFELDVFEGLLLRLFDFLSIIRI